MEQAFFCYFQFVEKHLLILDGGEPSKKCKTEINQRAFTIQNIIYLSVTEKQTKLLGEI